MGWNVLKFPLNCPKFGLATGLIYLLTAGAFLTTLSDLGIGDFLTAIGRIGEDLLSKPFAWIWVLIVMAGSIAYADNHRRGFKVVAGLLHGSAHLIAVFFASWFIAHCFGDLLTNIHLVLDLLVKAVLIFIAGYLFGGIYMGVYLFISLNWFGGHGNEAFGSLANPDYKNFVRIKIDKETKNLKVFPVGIDKVPKGDEWEEKKIDGIPAELNPVSDISSGNTEYSRLIETPFSIYRNDSETRQLSEIETPDEIRKIDG